MKEINISRMLVTKRKEKGITQEELALYIGVSKAAVSKWETGQSYPDITFLPQLAAYFNISIDELMGYSPQMEKNDIKKLYYRLSSDFATKPAEEVLEECREIVKKYYSCFPLLFQMAVLQLNYHMLAGEKKMQEAVLESALGLCIRIRNESKDVLLSKDAISLESACYIILQKPLEVLELLGESIRPSTSDDVSIAQAYQMLGNVQKAKEISQVSMYQHLLALVGTASSYLLLNADSEEKSGEVLHRALSVAAIYDLDNLHPNVMGQLYFTAAHVRSLQGDTKGALDLLQKYAGICTKGFFPYTLHGDSYFDAIDGWFSELDLGTDAPRNEKAIREGMLQSVLSNPAFMPFREEPRYRSIIESLKSNLGGK